MNEARASAIANKGIDLDLRYQGIHGTKNIGRRQVAATESAKVPPRRGALNRAAAIAKRADSGEAAITLS
jgi:hypothetical protein